MSRGEAARGESRVCPAAVSAPGLARGPLPQVLGGAHRGPFCLPNAEEPRGALRTGSGSGRGRAAFPLCPCVQGLSHTATRPRGRRSRGRSRGTSRTLVLGPASPSRKLSPPAGPVPDGVRDPWVGGGVTRRRALGSAHGPSLLPRGPQHLQGVSVRSHSKPRAAAPAPTRRPVRAASRPHAPPQQPSSPPHSDSTDGVTPDPETRLRRESPSAVSSAQGAHEPRRPHRVRVGDGSCRAPAGRAGVRASVLNRGGAWGPAGASPPGRAGFRRGPSRPSSFNFLFLSRRLGEGWGARGGARQANPSRKAGGRGGWAWHLLIPRTEMGSGFREHPTLLPAPLPSASQPRRDKASGPAVATSKAPPWARDSAGAGGAVEERGTLPLPPRWPRGAGRGGRPEVRGPGVVSQTCG